MKDYEKPIAEIVDLASEDVMLGGGMGGGMGDGLDTSWDDTPL